MTDEQGTLYEAFMAHDRRFDGRFFTAVKTTGVYCRPVCRVRMPKPQNCLFFSSAAAAEHAGYRPCLKCRPELAPGVAGIDSESRIAQAAAELIDAGFLQDTSLANLATHLHITDRHMRRNFQAYWGVSPVAYAQTHKLLLAKQLLTETSLPVTGVAYSSGFDSLSRFNSLFKSHYRLSPSRFRQQTSPSKEATLTLCIGYRPPFDWDAILSFLAGRAIAGVEVAGNNTYKRTVSLNRSKKFYQGWIEVSHQAKKSQLLVHMPTDLAPVAAVILARIKHLFDTDCQPDIVAAHLGPLAASNPGLRVPGVFDGFEMSVRAVLGQQISVKAATVIAGRLAATFGPPISTPHAGLTTIFPPPAVLANASLQDLIGCGLYSKRAETIQSLARACVDGLYLTPQADISSTIATLKALPGIGEWTAQYIALRALAWPDAFPHTDYAVKKVLGEQNPTKVLELAKPWQPWRAYATMHLWQSLNQSAD